jgi:murein DD-endopeptidase MepM/ murein hydrolase activator NlpD
VLSDKLSHIFDTLGIANQSVTEENQNFKLDQLYTISQLDNIENKMENISYYIENFRTLFKKIPSIFPIVSRKYWFTSPYGLRRHPITLKMEFHPAIDIAAFPGTPIQAAADGYIDYSGWRGGYGIVVYLNHDKGYQTRYAHMARLGPGIHKNKKVRKGQIIGYVGTTGVSTGYHLHYEVRLNGRTVNPMYFAYLDRFWR